MEARKKHNGHAVTLEDHQEFDIDLMLLKSMIMVDSKLQCA